MRLEACSGLAVQDWTGQVTISRPNTVRVLFSFRDFTTEEARYTYAAPCSGV